MNQPKQTRVEKELWAGKPSMLTAPRKALTQSYRLTSERLKIEYGLLSKRTEDIELFRVQDLSVERTVFDRMFGVGNIVIVSGDVTGGVLVLWDVADAEHVKDMIRDASRIERQRHRVGVFEENWMEMPGN